MVPSQIERLLKLSNNYPLLSHTKIPPNHNIFLYILLLLLLFFFSTITKAPKDKTIRASTVGLRNTKCKAHLAFRPKTCLVTRSGKV